MDKKRTFVKTSQGVLHRPGCPSLKRLVLPTETIEMTAMELKRHDAWWLGRFMSVRATPGSKPWSVEEPVWRVASCCGRYGRTREVISHKWAEGD